MATSSQAYPHTSSNPTSPLTSSSPTSSNGPDGAITDLFSSAGSPPLIVAFLAIGLFVAAMICVFGWRRLSQSRGLNNQPNVPLRRHKSIPLGKKPVLWDVWADSKLPGESLTEATRWEHITPMTTSLTLLVLDVQPPSPVEPPPPPIRRMDPNDCKVFRTLQSILFAVKRLYFPHSHPSLPLPSLPLDELKEVEPVSPISDGVEWGDVSSVHVSVIITMPAQRRYCDTDSEQVELGEYCIGTTVVPWSEGG